MNFNLSAHAAWAPGLGPLGEWPHLTGDRWPTDDGSAPKIEFVDALLRRRLGRLSRMALHVAQEAVGDLPTVTSIFASRHGELARTVSILHALATAETPSPAAFSLSVHNAAAGIFAITRGDTAPSIALAAGEETLLWALLDAHIRLCSTPDTPILLAYADEPLPTEYRDCHLPREPAHALGLLLQSGDGLRLTWQENRNNTPSREPFSLALLAYLQGWHDSIEWHGGRLSVIGHA